jgi:hypothetical protein
MNNITMAFFPFHFEIKDDKLTIVNNCSNEQKISFFENQLYSKVVMLDPSILCYNNGPLLVTLSDKIKFPDIHIDKENMNIFITMETSIDTDSDDFTDKLTKEYDEKKGYIEESLFDAMNSVIDDDMEICGDVTPIL